MTIKFDDEEDELVFPSGKRLYCFSGTVGIGIGTQLSVEYGSDGQLDDDSLTKEEKRLLADYMIARWQNYKEAVK